MDFTSHEWSYSWTPGKENYFFSGRLRPFIRGQKKALRPMPSNFCHLFSKLQPMCSLCVVCMLFYVHVGYWFVVLAPSKVYFMFFSKKKLNQIKVEFCHANSFFFNATPLLYSYFFIACSFTYSRYLSRNVGVIGKSNQSIYVSSLVIYIVKCKKWFLMN